MRAHHFFSLLPGLLISALAHAQFETIHPFLDGNGRVGRLLITFMLVEAKILAKPLLYLSVFLKEHRTEYYDRLTAVRAKGDWEAWVKYFLNGVSETAKMASVTGVKIIKLREQHRTVLSKNRHGLALLDSLFDRPILDVKRASEVMQCSVVTAGKVVRDLVADGIIVEMTGQARNRVFRYEPFLALFENPKLD